MGHASGGVAGCGEAGMAEDGAGDSVMARTRRPLRRSLNGGALSWLVARTFGGGRTGEEASVAVRSGGGSERGGADGG